MTMSEHDHGDGFVAQQPTVREFVLCGGPVDGRPFTLGTCEHGGWPDLTLFAKREPGRPLAPELSYRFEPEQDAYVYIGQSVPSDGN